MKIDLKKLKHPELLEDGQGYLVGYKEAWQYNK